MKPLPFREVRKRLFRLGFVEAGQHGSHIKFVLVNDIGTVVVMVPKHREIASGTLRSILRQARLTENDFEDLK